ncbi:MAG TPA: hypothetical protein VFA77_17800 [Candidatus Eisenbacteria bacterium]|jgi:L-alanine-DL-glutamate epimerase-like enolase superfamily enzyme|nr:hypothetical protein [Candidatus Eisenbacteria bacterium]
MKIKIQDFDLHQITLQTRLPFRYGIATMTRVPQVFLRLWAEVDGNTTVGIAADLLPPKWFTKNPVTTLEEEVAEMLQVIRHALVLAKGAEGESPFAIWREMYRHQLDWGGVNKLPPLLANFGTSLVERALIEAVGRATGQSFSQMLQSNLLGIRLGDIHPELSERTPADFLPATPLPKIIARHTVGLADPLTEADIAPADRLNDGLPQSLEASIQTYGLRHFKIKVSGDVTADQARLLELARIFEKLVPADYLFTLDGNEHFKSLEDFRKFWTMLWTPSRLHDLRQHLCFVEQPLHRDVALAATLQDELLQWPDRPAMIIDESDAVLESLPAALRLGYSGTSHKNCKGIFKGIINRCLLSHRQREDRAASLIMSGEDLCNVGPVALLQDLAVMAALGIQSVERNGHHYLAGLSQFPNSIQQQILAHHDDLFRSSKAGWPTLRIEQGEIRLDSVNQSPFGVGFVLEAEQFEQVRQDQN